MKAFGVWLWLVVLVIIIAGIVRLRFDVKVLNLLPQKLPVAQGLKIYQQNFSDARELIITLEAPTADEAASGAHSLAEVLRSETNPVADVTWQPGWMESPAQATELIAALWLNQPPAQIGELTNRLAVANLTNILTEVRESLATSLSPDEIGLRGYDPYGLMRLPDSVSGAVPSMAILHWDWNILNLMALPLLLGMGVDFSIHMQLTLRRYRSDLLTVRRSLGRALLLAGATAVAGFGSLAFSTNAGMASLGKVCALGITLALLVAVCLLPVWSKAWMKTPTIRSDKQIG